MDCESEVEYPYSVCNLFEWTPVLTSRIVDQGVRVSRVSRGVRRESDTVE